MFDDVFVANMDILPITTKYKILLSEYWFNQEKKKSVFFQTKSLDNVLDHYIISSNKILWIKKFDLVEVPIEERPNADRGGIWAVAGMTREKNIIYEKFDYTGKINIYTTSKSKTLDNLTDFWYEFDIYFVKGKIKNVEIIELPDIPDVIEKELLELFDIEED